MKRSIITVAAIGLWSAVSLAQQGVPNVGEHIYQSPPDREQVKSGCPMKFDMTKHLLTCASANQLRGKCVSVTLTAGSTTTKSDSSVKATSNVRCGCQFCPDTPIRCNLGGQWIAKLRVESVSAGSFQLGHGRALGDEVIPCVVED